MENKCTDNAVELLADEDDEEALSLSDLPLIRKEREEEENVRPREIGIEEDFDFCSLSKESEMCAADEVFFQGQILPLRHSVSSEKGLLQYCDGRRRSISSSESMDHCCSGGLISSRSSSISSHQSSSSGSSATTAGPKYKPGLPPRIQFHSHPSPSPRIWSNRPGTISTNHRNFAKKSSAWNIFRLGLVTAPPEIAFQDFKSRCPTNSTTCKNFGSRNSTSSNGSSISCGNSKNKIKNKPRGLLGGCKRSVDAVDTVPSRVVIIKRSASDGDVETLQENVEEMKSPKLTKKQAAKKQLSHHRTFEWLKQLSLEGAVDEA